MDVWTFIQDEVKAGFKVMFMVVAAIKGSTPGRPGFKMAVSESGRLSGSVGGGHMEYNMVVLARDLIKQKDQEPLIVKQVHDNKAGKESSGLLCSGMQVNILFPLDQIHLEVVDAIVDSIAQGGSGLLNISPDYISFSHASIDKNSIEWHMASETNWEYSEQMGVKPVIVVFGGGHISVPLSQLMRMLGFEVRIYDNREKLNTLEINQYAHKKEVIDYAKASSYVVEGENSYAAIMTTSHEMDELVLSKLLPMKLKYLGMIGSRKKIKTIFDNLRNSGATQEQLDRVDSPMGVDIGSQTVEEIAVSIAARIIQVKNT